MHNLEKERECVSVYMCVSSRITAGSLLTTTCNFAFSRNADSLFIRSIRRDLSFRFPQKRGNRTPPLHLFTPALYRFHPPQPFDTIYVETAGVLYILLLLRYRGGLTDSCLETDCQSAELSQNAARYKGKGKAMPICQFSLFVRHLSLGANYFLLFYGRNCSSNFMFSRRMLVSK